MKRQIKKAFNLALMFTPSFIKVTLLNKFMGCEIDKTAYIGISYIDVKKIKMDKGARIKHFNIIRNVDLLQLDAYASMGNFNKISALPLESQKHFLHERSRAPTLTMGEHSSVVTGHFFDCCNAITIGAYATIAGFGSSFFTHGIDIAENCQSSAPISVGAYSMVSACCVLTKGSALPNYSVLGANSTLHKSHDQPYTLYSGVPAVAVKELPKDSKFFTRQKGFVE
jgi:acetyltransferase-like isoleucine patch superfamily enzyme